jgi:hypothetical protein
MRGAHALVGTYHHGGRARGAHVHAPHGQVGRARVSSGSPMTLTRRVRAHGGRAWDPFATVGGAHGSPQGPP